MIKPFALPGWRPRLRIDRLFLPLTSSVVALLVALPAVQLLRHPRPRAQGLEQLMTAASLLQSFPATPTRPVPALWQERLGAELAGRLWRQQRRAWWQFWGIHADGAPYLALTASGPLLQDRSRLPANSLRVGNLLVVAADPLSRQMLQTQLRPQQRASRGVQGRCLELLEKRQGVFWNPSALGVIVGDVAPLLQRFQEGCLELQLESRSLRWQGEAAAIDGVLAARPAVAPTVAPPPPPLPADVLLEIEGTALEPLLQGLLARQLIREPLASRYGLDPSRQRLLSRSPFRLRLRPQPSGRFQASLELQLLVGNQERRWQPLLLKVAESLRQQGLRQPGPQPPEQQSAAARTPERQAPEPQSADPKAPVPKAADPKAADSQAPGLQKPALQPPDPRMPAGPSAGSPASGIANPRAAEEAVWSRDDGVIVGGWRWLKAGRERQLLLYLGPTPSLPLPYRPEAEGSLAQGGLRLRARPLALQQLGLLPSQMPPLVQRAEQLAIESRPAAEGQGSASSLSQLWGSLQLGR